MFHSFGHKYCCGGGEGKGLAAYVELYFGPEVFGVIGVAANMQDNLIVFMSMFGYKVWFGYIVW